MVDTVNALDIITDAMFDLGVLTETESPSAAQNTLAVRRLNRMLEGFSTQPKLCFCYREVIHEIVGGQTNYSIGPNGQVTCNFVASIDTFGVMTVTLVNSGALSTGMKFNATINSAAVEVTIGALGTGVGGNGSLAAGTYYTSLTGQTVASATFTAYAERPLAILRAFVRVSSSGGPLDYPVAIEAMDNFTLLGLKQLSGPWPRMLYYNPTEPVGTIQYWQNPGQGEMHLFCQMQFTKFASAQDVVQLPPGYYQLLQHGLALNLASVYGAADPGVIGLISAQYTKDLEWLKAANKQPQQESRVDSVLQSRNRVDAGWILNGGFS